MYDLHIESRNAGQMGACMEKKVMHKHLDTKAWRKRKIGG
jgi:hypothetical protein